MISYQYDKAGNMTQFVNQGQNLTITYSYNAANELTSQTSGSTQITYSYDGDGNLTGYTNGPTFSYTGPSQTERVQETNSSGTETFVNSGLGVSSKTNSSGTDYYTRCSCGMLIGERASNGKDYYYLLDAQESVVAVTDSSGNVVNRYVYDPYGNLFLNDEGISNPWKFESGYMDNSTGLLKFGTRYYNPALGRWTQQDPVAGSLADAQGLNRYIFAGDDPTNQIDPSGEFSTLGLLGSCLGAAAGAAIVTVLGLAVGIITAPASLPVGAFIFLTVTIACIGGEITYAVVEAIGG